MIVYGSKLSEPGQGKISKKAMVKSTSVHSVAIRIMSDDKQENVTLRRIAQETFALKMYLIL
jgi:hypothetical protein